MKFQKDLYKSWKLTLYKLKPNKNGSGFLDLAILMHTQTVLCAIGSAKKGDTFKVGVAI